MNTERAAWMLGALLGVSASSCASPTPQGEGGEDQEEPSAPEDPEPAPGAVCLTASFDPEPPPLDVLFLLNRSLGMMGPAWFRSIDILSEGLVHFADTVRTPELKLGLQAFPPLQGEPCMSSSYHELITDFAQAPTVGEELKRGLEAADSIENQRMIGGNPLRPALLGAYRTLRQRRELTPKLQTALVLVTDHSYYDCGTLYTWEDLYETVEREAEEDPPIPTFIALPEGSPFLDRYHALARSGGTESAFLLGGDSHSSELSRALLAYRRTSQACAFDLPEPQGLRLDPLSVTLRFQESPELPPRRLPLLDDLAACRGGKEGFYYEDPNAPRRLSLCPTSCAIAESAGESGTLKIDVGCLEVIR